MLVELLAVLVLVAAMWYWRRRRPTHPLDALGRVESHREWRSKD